jgi:hypothetical protein
LAAFDLAGNFDRVMGLMGAIVGLNERQNKFELMMKEESQGNTNHYDIDYSIFDKIRDNRSGKPAHTHAINSLNINFNDLII